ncbi:MAG: chromosomal replication initiator protein DnaA [Armatimonadetes bacterium]|nr:chromosomal replication initiator protein DnaA [Armatimonadota bacterium]
MSDSQLQLGEDESYRALQSSWEQVLDALSERVNKPSFESWIRTARPLGMDGGLVRIGTPSRFAKHWLESKHLDAITELLEAQLGPPIRVKIELVEENEPVLLTEKLPRKPAGRTAEDDDVISQPLNSRYVFDNFVVGPNNRLAHACAVSVAESPGKTYNPLFIYGGPGLGKTHLMQAIGHYVLDNHPGTRVLYVSGETFTYHYITALREHRTADFRRKYRNVDIWLVDDIHFLVGKERTEEEFFHTYNAIYDMGKQIVLTSDRAPKDLDLDTRLLSRFECGLVADITPPDLETRMAIIQSKAASENMTLSNEVMLYIARLITSNIRQIEGALIKLHAYASLMRAPVTESLAQEVLGNYFGEVEIAVVDAQKVQQEVAKRFNVDVAAMKGACRSKDIVLPRQVAMYLMRELTNWSLPAIGRVFGGRDHTTVLHACKCIAAKIAADQAFAALIEDLARRIRGGKTC